MYWALANWNDAKDEDLLAASTLITSPPRIAIMLMYCIYSRPLCYDDCTKVHPPAGRRERIRMRMMADSIQLELRQERIHTDRYTLVRR